MALETEYCSYFAKEVSRSMRSSTRKIIVLSAVMVGLFSAIVTAEQSDPCSIPRVLTSIRPGAAWTMQGDKYAGLKWLDKKQAKPTESEITTAVATCKEDFSARVLAKQKARKELKDPTVSTDKKVQDLILLLDYDR